MNWRWDDRWERDDNYHEDALLMEQEQHDRETQQQQENPNAHPIDPRLNRDRTDQD